MRLVTPCGAYLQTWHSWIGGGLRALGWLLGVSPLSCPTSWLPDPSSAVLTQGRRCRGSGGPGWPQRATSLHNSSVGGLTQGRQCRGSGGPGWPHRGPRACTTLLWGGLPKVAAAGGQEDQVGRTEGHEPAQLFCGGADPRLPLQGVRRTRLAAQRAHEPVQLFCGGDDPRSPLQGSAGPGWPHRGP